MKNFTQMGDTVTALAPYALASGDGALVGSLFGVATSAAANSATVELVTEGVFELKAANADTATQFAKAYWDNTAKQITTTSTANSLVGVFMVPKAAGLVATVRLNAVSI